MTRHKGNSGAKRHLSQQEFQERTLAIETVFENITDAFYALDGAWRFTYLNAEAERLLHRQREELLGKVIWDEFPETTFARFGAEYQRAVQEGVSITVEEFYPPLATWFEIRAYPLQNDAATGVSSGLSVYFRDISERKRVEEERERALANLRESEERLHLALASGGLGTWDADLLTGMMTLSAEIPPLYGRPRQEIILPISTWVAEWLHPDDRERVPQAFAAAIRGESDYDVEFRTIWPDGKTYRWIATRAIITRNSEGAAIRAVGYTRNVTQEKEQQAEREALLLHQRQFMRDMLRSLTEGKFLLCLEAADLPAVLPPAADLVDLSVSTLSRFRKRVNAVTTHLHFSPEREQDLVTAVGEAAMNAVTHGGGGTGMVRADGQRGVVQIWIRDAGAGISEEALPRVLEKGVSTAGSLGHGFWLMLRTGDRVYLLTGPTGTTVVLEMEKETPEPAWLKSVG